MKNEKLTIDQIREKFPDLVHRTSKYGWPHRVGVIEGDGFLIKGEGITEEEAWKDAYHWMTNYDIDFFY